MLKDVESPWPLAEIVYQHHERMDGSGYPRCLKGEEILMEARILAVADVVEGISETLSSLAMRNGTELMLFTDPGIPSQVMGNAGRLRQILVNLANNAIKFSGGLQRQGKVSVRAVLVEDNSHFIAVRPEPHSAQLRTGFDWLSPNGVTV